ncbi:MAG: 30S ribosome-binding factor RbfA [Verrucomicrobia bacterium]|nr:30S ribosome-binding factor RbfA [Verrucomicrobiota bacterium]MBU6446071.1 30S ribosome-binding factor RbfA [Verrucomicrobiota bacterium]MDE3048240.1 30S ribosome-binding factor RbfA [Verrucomicrobiota bacterium]
MKKNRLARVNSLLKEVIFEVVQKEVRNPNVTTFVSITHVDTSADLHHAKVFVSLICSEEEKSRVLAALNSAAGFIAVHAAKKVQLRYFPELQFRLDTSSEEHMKIQQILGELEKERNSREQHS